MAGFDLSIHGTEVTVLFEGTIVEGADAAPVYPGADAFRLSFLDPPTGSALATNVADNDPRISTTLLFGFTLEFLSQPWIAHIHLRPEDNLTELFCQPQWDHWRSIISYATLRSAVVSAAPEFGAKIDEELEDELLFVIPTDFKHCSLQDVITTTTETAATIFKKAFRRASHEAPDGIVAVFDFPPAVSSACEQYLIHFADFLRDIGVDAAADVRHEAGAVLFAVTPRDKTHALAIVREALRVYLSLPSAAIEGVAQNLQEQIIMDKMAMTIFHLNAQITSAAMMLRLQDATISAQQCAIDVQQRLLAAAKPSPESEPLLSGVLDVVPVVSSGLRINLPQIVRRLKDLVTQRNR